MAKDPAFLFYTGDFSTGTQFMSDEQVGKYIRLLMAQHQLGHLKESHVLQICKSYDNDVMCKFVKDSDGLWYNERLDNEIVKRKNYSKSRAENRSGKNHISKTHDIDMENKNIDDSNIIVIGDKADFSISILKKYTHEKPIVIYDLKLYFESTGQAEQMAMAKLNRFDDFMKKNPAAIFNDADHLYKSFRKFHEGKTNFTAPRSKF